MTPETRQDLQDAEAAKSAAQGLRRTGRAFLIVAVLLGLGLLYNGWRTYDLSRETKEQIRASQLEACERGNLSRTARVVSLWQDIGTLQADLELVRSQAPFIPIGPLSTWRTAKLDGIDAKRESIRSEIQSVERYAERPNSVRVDCQEQYPPL